MNKNRMWFKVIVWVTLLTMLLSTLLLGVQFILS